MVQFALIPVSSDLKTLSRALPNKNANQLSARVYFTLDFDFISDGCVLRASGVAEFALGNELSRQRWFERGILCETQARSLLQNNYVPCQVVSEWLNARIATLDYI